MNRHQTAVAAEAFAAGVFAQAGCSVFVQYGANQPGYDLMVSNGANAMHVSVKGSSNGGWLLTAKDKNGTYQQAFDEWLTRNKDYIFCLVQFYDKNAGGMVKVGTMPTMYLATGDEIGTELKRHWFGKEMSLSLYEHYAPTRGKYKGEVMGMPEAWRMGEERIRALMSKRAESCNPSNSSSAAG
ncbi:MAG: hypothetical protein AABP62_27760 [Planctomycetota bacterium]